MATEEKLLELVKDKFEDKEKIISYVQGAFQTTVKNKNTLRTGILVATNKKIRFCGKRFFFIYDDEIEYADIYNTEVIEERFGHRIFIHGKKKSYFMKFVISNDLDNFINTLKEYKGKRK
jgi:hypothetical protein